MIDARAFQKITGFIERAKKNPACEFIHGGTYSDAEGYFIDPTIIVSSDPHSETMVQEIFGPVLTIHVYDSYEKVLSLIDTSTVYGLTGAM